MQRRFAAISLALDEERCFFADATRLSRPEFGVRVPPSPTPAPPALSAMTQAELEQELDWAREALLSRVHHLQARAE